MSGPVRPGVYVVSLPGNRQTWVHVVPVEEAMDPPVSATPPELADTESREVLEECA